MAQPQSGLLQGTLDMLVLKALTWGPRHGYEVVRWIRDTTDDVLLIEDGALYTALHRMHTHGWLSSEWGISESNRRAKYYQLTPLGRRQLHVESSLWDRYAEAVFKVMRTV
jgi:PadR family transcriptional regulator, regulatory protein PadR